MNLLYIGLGGFLGSICRYLSFQALDRYYHRYHFPLGTLAVNALGSFLIGAALALSIKHNILGRHTLGHFLLVTGFLGGFTTFSAFSQDNLILIMEKQYWLFALNTLLNVGLGLALVAAGYMLVERCF
ncbi:hypothetical protein A2276_02135 [candidate division WOR-1 bacterium RIFOXYA12_FULL_43_27]|uniref:Fluoride-specific ion channel FluC n=1 Tax=candidate division WOR-1 bacterium RIFOXYC2_FULL_46_14 TaxID=1802587 RepID=A0A1F4U7Z4_UNCSA|nr:MAG: hypothetical protein A2276_02135 [candidate division WOR-1 bacterium RIFOXYA12_FULL_43_27]OGC19481.1 MAG: hypothetical protein A2292_02195 [candidate division WOR-1 bacterium RIFOXYB2_FULL_46_45]OGC30469.1 MAG: hypothetical protein A2232_02195 [candidate division WOR-1 bacterium RIFOXYA2_FULL_46_56]OGC41068.1 MAG: hypothetical protein A2438_02190 [candidate division WOR-1 bacterium RIFOXYC2_FULL_46_14]